MTKGGGDDMSPSSDTPSDTGWQRFVDVHEVGDVLDATVTAVMPFGAFVEVGDAVSGLLVDARPAVGQTVEVRIAEIDPDMHRVKLTPA
jgi:small subunit ribosomal protein S1